jgi:dihydrofolate synthase/folylpolyglutamate synthase
LIDNFATAFCAYALLGYELDIKLLEGLKLFGRCQKVASNVTIDVGHNPMAAEALREHFSQRQVNLVYNSYNDKEYERILQILKPIIRQVEILPIENLRVVEQKKLLDVLEKLEIEYKIFDKIKEGEEYLVFGSFSVIEKFLKVYKI